MYSNSSESIDKMVSFDICENPAVCKDIKIRNTKCNKNLFIQ